MRVYSPSSEEALFVRNLLKDWAEQTFLTEEQHRHMEQGIDCDLRRTNTFLRVVLFLFTAIIVGGASALISVGFPLNEAMQPLGILLLIIAAISYAAAEFIASRGFYRYGIEEALAVCAVALLCTAIFLISSSGSSSLKSDGTELLVAIVGAITSLGIWHRFGLTYAFVAAMIFAAWLSGCLTSSASMQRLILGAFYAVGLVSIDKLRSRNRFDYLDQEYSITEALLWLGIYLVFNLQLSSVDLLALWWGGPSGMAGFSKVFYWSTWVMTWCIPSVTLWWGLRQKDQLVIAVGGVIAILTLVTNKPYLGWQRHSWDPMLLGAFLIGLALSLHRWLSKVPSGIRFGFTARRLSGKNQRWMNAVSVGFDLTSPQPATVNSQISNPGAGFGGGDFGGGGASSDF